MKKIKLFAFAVMTVLSVASVTYLNSCKKDPCKDVVCNNGGTCVDGNCSCATGYEGTNCDAEMRTKFIVSSTSFTEACNGGSTYNITISKGTSISDVIIENLGNYACTSGSYTVKATVDGTNLTIPSQTVCSTVFSGTGTITNGKVSISYKATYGTPSVTDDCTATQN
ncbi:MAG: EGF-like domain [Bacteroidota bacterium]|jgi:hypothetical protein